MQVYVCMYLLRRTKSNNQPERNAKMDNKQFKKMLARLSLASLLAGAGLTVPASNAWCQTS